MFKYILTGLMTVFITIAGWIGYQQNLGTTVPVSVAVFETTLSAKIGATSTSMTLVTGADKAGADLDGYMCFTLDGGKTTEEFVCGTASSTAVTSMIRGLSPVTASSTGALCKEHRAGSSVKITDYPQLAIISRIINGNETFPYKLSYATDNLVFLTDAQIPSKKYVDHVATEGAAFAGFEDEGLVELATGTDIGKGNATGSTGAWLVVPNIWFSSTSQATSVPVSNVSGKIAQGWLDLTAAFTFSGALNASSTLEVTGSTTIKDIRIQNLYASGTILLPSASTTLRTQPAIKDYVDEEDHDLFGTANAVATATTYQATTSGFVYAKYTADGGTTPQVYLLTDTNASPTTVVLIQKLASNYMNYFVFPIKRGNYWNVNWDSGNLAAKVFYWISTQ